MKLILSLLISTLALAAQTHLSVTVNGGAPRIAAGSPWIVAATATGATIGAAGPAFTVRVTSALGDEVALTLRPERQRTIAAGGAETTVQLWTLSPEAAASLRPGVYTARALQGDLTSPPVDFTVDLAEPTDALLLSRWEEIEGRLEQALAIVDQLLAQQPALVSALIRKCDLVAAQGRAADALRLLDQAAALLDQGADADGLMEIQVRRRSLLRVVLKEDLLN